MDSIITNLPNRPIVIIHKGWAPSNRRRNATKPVLAVDQPHFETHNFAILSRRGKCLTTNSPEEETRLTNRVVPTTLPPETGQRFDFVINGSEPLHTKDAATRKLVRSHAMKEVHRERREREKMKLRDASAQCTIIDEPSGASLPLELPSEQLSADTVGAAPLAQHKSEFCALQPDYHFTDPFRKVSVNVSRLATVYFTQLGSAMFPIEFHLAYDPPAQLLVLDPSFIGDAVLQSLAFAAAVCATLAGGRRDDSIVTMEMSRTIGLINRLLEGGRGMADGLLGAVCNLAIGEALRGNFGSWAVHMAGLKKMVEMRGGMSKVHLYLRMKLYRADLLGSIDQVSRPFFRFGNSHPSAIRSNSYLPAHDALLNAATTEYGPGALLPQSANILNELRDFCRAIEQTLPTATSGPTPKDILEAWCSIQYQLLSSLPTEQGVTDNNLATENDELQEAFRLGATIYMKEMLHNFTFSATGSRILVSKLASCLHLIIPTGSILPSSSLILWLLFMGSIASVKNSKDRKFFLTHLAKLQRGCGIRRWEDVKYRLESVLWVGSILDKAGSEVWEEVDAYREAV